MGNKLAVVRDTRVLNVEPGNPAHRVEKIIKMIRVSGFVEHWIGFQADKLRENQDSVASSYGHRSFAIENHFFCWYVPCSSALCS